MTVPAVIGLVVRLFLLLTPFFVLSVFITVCDSMDLPSRKSLARRTGLAVIVICLLIYLFGELIFHYLGITLDAFRIGSGLVLMLSGIGMVQDTGEKPPKTRQVDHQSSTDLSVVPLAIPCTVGPGTIGTLVVMGVDCPSWNQRLFEVIAIVLAASCVGLVLYYSDKLSRILKNRGVRILSKLTGMYLVALAAQIMSDGIRNMFFAS